MWRFLASNTLAILSLIAIKNSQREIREGQGARADQSSFCPRGRGWLSPSLNICFFATSLGKKSVNSL
jgi:hypothetical protein